MVQQQRDDKQPKSVFDDKFFYLKIPKDILMLNIIDLTEKMILSRIIYWTKKGMPCTHSNAQFAELIGRSERQVKRVVNKLLRLKLVDAFYKGNGQLKHANSFRDLIARVGVPPNKMITRMIKDYKFGYRPIEKVRQDMDVPVLLKNPQNHAENDAKNEKIADQDTSVPLTRTSTSPYPGHPRPTASGHPRPTTTKEQLKNTTKDTTDAPPPPTPLPALRQASASASRFEQHRKEKKEFVPMSDEEFQKLKAQKISALKALGA